MTNIELLEPIAAELTPNLIHIDGKVLRATRTSEHSKTGLLVINAYLSNRQVTIGQILADKKVAKRRLFHCLSTIYIFKELLLP